MKINPSKKEYTFQTPQINNNNNAAPVAINANNNDQNNIDLNYFPHKGIFQPKPNILICKVHCCCKFIGLYVILFGLIFAIVFPTVGILNKKIIFTIIGIIIFSICLIVSIILFCLVTTEVKFIFNEVSVNIIISKVCQKREQIVPKEEIANIIFDYEIQEKGKVYQELHIMFKNGIQYNYFGFSSNPPCFTKYEIIYFNKEVKKLLEN